MAKQARALWKRDPDQKWPVWTPADLREWLNKPSKNSYLPFDPDLVCDPRMQPVWDWHANLEWRDRRDYGEGAQRLFRSSLSFCASVKKATQLPGKPGNLPPKERAAYLAKVRSHAEALIDLLEGTKFSVGDLGPMIEEDDQEKSVMRALSSWGVDEMGHVVAFWIDEDGLYQMPWDYPDSHLIEQLHSLISWTLEDDFFDRSFMRSSKPIGHSRSRGTKSIYFTCTLYEELERHGAAIPFSLLATVANVALGLEDDEMLDEDSVRKQVRRYQAKNSSDKTQRKKIDLGDPPF